MAAITWEGDESTNWETGGNWSGGVKPTNADDVTLDATASDSCVLNAASVCKTLTITSAYADSFDTNGNTLTVSGPALFNSSGTGDLTIDALVTLNADGDFSIGTWNAVDCTAGSVDLQGTGDFDNSSGGSLVLVKITAAAAGKKTNQTGTSNWFCQQYTGGAGEFDINARYLLVHPTGATDIVLHADHDFTGDAAGTLYIRPDAAITLLLPKITITTAKLYLSQRADNISGIQCQGNIVCANLDIIKAYDSNFTVDFNDQNITSAKVQFGNTKAAGTLVFNFGSGTIDVSDDIYSTSYNTGATTLNLESSTITCAGDFSLGTLTTLDAGTSSLTFDGVAQLITLEGESLYTVIQDNNSLTPQDAFACNSLTVNGTSDLDFNGQTVNCAAGFVWDSSGTLTADGALILSGTGNLTADGETLSRLIITSSATITWNAAGTIVVSTYTNGDWDTATFVSSTPNTAYTIDNPASMRVRNVNVTNSTATSLIIATGTDGGGNTLWDFSPNPLVGYKYEYGYGYGYGNTSYGYEY